MTNIEKWPEAFENGIPKAGGRWTHPLGNGPATVASVSGERVQYAYPRGYDVLASFLDGTLTFLGFSYSAQGAQEGLGAAAPQKPGLDAEGRPIVGTCWEAHLNPGSAGPERWVVDGFSQYDSIQMRTFQNGAWGPKGVHSWPMDAFRAQTQKWTLIPDPSKPAPLVAPPPSPKAAVQQEGLSIPPQTGTRHEWWEAKAHEHEDRREYERAKLAQTNARVCLDFDLAYDAEASAIREGRTVLKAALKEMGQGDRRCFDLRGLREFEAIRSAEHAKWNWWVKP